MLTAAEYRAKAQGARNLSKLEPTEKGRLEWLQLALEWTSLAATADFRATMQAKLVA